MTNNPTPITARECAERLLALRAPVILTHRSPDADTLGSGTALTLALRALGKDATLICPDPIPERLAFLTEGVPMGEEPYGEESVSIDVASRNMLGALSHLEPVLMIDHHATGVPFADYFTIPDLSSAGEVLYLVLRELESMCDFRITADIAARLYAAISSDTGGFIYSSVTPDTMRIAASLIEYGIDFADINHRLFNSKSPSQIRAEGYTASNLKSALDGRISYAYLPLCEREAMGLSFSDFETAIDVVRSVMGAEVAIFVRESEEGKFRASLRSTELNVAQVAKEFDGGGHVHAAGCNPVAKSAEEAAKAIVESVIQKLTK